ncbi:MAG: TolC family protein [Phormidesmis sp. FL-bin-119]|nr:TolC family protein [Pedobacter sp.]
MRNKIISLLFVLSFASPSFAAVDVDTLTWVKFREIINLYHPVMEQSNLIEARAKARARQALGNFEPKFSYNYDQKNFDGLTYYRFSTPEVKLPLWYGMELKANWSRAEGSYLNPENRLPGEGLSSVGLNLPLGKGLLMDNRRALLRQAAIFKEASKVEQVRIINDLMFEAGEAYANWQTWYRINELYDQALELAEVRFRAVKEGFAGGDRPAIDTIEALTQVQQRQLNSQQAKILRQNSQYELSLFLWLPGNESVEPESLLVLPQSETIRPTARFIESIDNNPKLRLFEFKLRDLEIEKRLKAENLRPTIDLQLGLLNTGTGAFRNLNPNYWQNNNKVGLKISFPLTFATERGELAESIIKIKDTQIEQNLVRNELEVKLRQNTAEFMALQSQLSVIRQTQQAHQKLLEGEEIRFSLGESSLFLINARESKLLEIKEKLIETENKLIKNMLNGEWLTGRSAD